MKTSPSKIYRVLRGGALGLCVMAVTSMGGIITPLYVGNSSPVLDQYGRPMVGSNLSEEAADRSRVELRTSTDAIIHPPSITGVAHPYNPLLTPDSIGGMGMNTSRPDLGIFAMSLTNRPASGTRIFARVFNAPTVAEASFYADTAMVDAPASASSLPLTFGTATALDTNDFDGDGLNNSWEKAMGTDGEGGVAPDDFDGDGMLDLHEMLAGTGGNDPDSLLSFRTIPQEELEAPLGEGDPVSRPVRVRWQSVPGKRYQLQFVPTLLGLQQFIPVPGVGDVDGVITAGTDEYVIDLIIDVPEGTTAGAFRVRLVHDGIEL